MVHRDPDTGQFVNDGHETGDGYMNTKHLFYSTTWGDQGDAGDGNDWDQTGLTGSGRTSVKTVQFDLDDNELVEIHGLDIDFGDLAAAEALSGKCDVFVFNGDYQGLYWEDIYNGGRADDLLLHASAAQASSPDNVQAAAHSGAHLQFNSPVLNAGEIGIVFREGPQPIGEIAGRVQYTVREFDESKVIREILESRA